jgi:rhodanese-related sulfurtransferase
MKSTIRIALLSFAAAFAALPALAEEDALTPTAAKGVQVISVEQARDLMGKAQFFDFRAGINYGKGHIKGAVPLPYDQKSEKSVGFDASKDKFDMAKLPRDKSLPIVFYSDGPTGWKSYKAAVTATRAGYTNVKWMRDGTSGWTEKGISLE